MRENKRSNIVWIVQDHIAFRQYKDFFKKSYPLKAYEKLAGEGMEFEKAYSVCPLCCPARASMITGLYPHNHKITQNGGKSLSRKLPNDVAVLGTELKAVGYEAQYFGKWHIGFENSAKDYGFDGWSQEKYGQPYKSKKYQEYQNKYNLPDPIADLDWCIGAKEDIHLNMKELEKFVGLAPNGYRSISSGVYEGPAEVDEAFFVVDMVCDWLENYDGENPFFLRVDTWGPHQPYIVGKPFADLIEAESIDKFPNFDTHYKDRPKFHREFKKMCNKKSGLHGWEEWQSVIARMYEHMIQTDEAILRVLDSIENLGLRDDTIIIMTADHGDITGIAGGLYDKGSMMVEETMQIPFVVKWPGVTKPNSKTQALVNNMDIVSTVLDITGIKTMDTDGMSIIPILKDENRVLRDDMMCEHHGHESDMFQRALYYKNYKFVAKPDDLDELYNLEDDQYELNNLIYKKKHSLILKEMQNRLIRNMDLYNDNSKNADTLINKINNQ